MKATLKISIMSFLLTGCISVSLGGEKHAKSSGVKSAPPGAPFEASKDEKLDQIWRNKKNGNAISFLSDCSDQSDPPLASIEEGVLSGLYPYAYVSQNDLSFDGRGARRSQVKGTVDGVATLVDLLVYKKNSCIYIISYAGLKNSHAEDQERFEAFLQRFHAP
jgi:hypothetical protein